MKKILLIAALAAVSVAVSAQTDITPSGYNFDNYVVGQVPTLVDNSNDWNAPTMTDAQIAALDPNTEGLIYPDLPYTNEEYQKACCVVDLGGEVGKVLAINLGGFDKFQTYSKTTWGEQVNNAPAESVGGLQWNFYTNPATTKRAGYIRTELVINGYSEHASPDAYVIENLYNMTSSNNVTPSSVIGGFSFEDNVTAANPVACDAFALLDDEGDPITDDDEYNMYDPNAWMTYTYDCRGTNSDDTDYSSAIKAKLYTGDGHKGEILFIKSIKFYDMTGAYSSTSDLILGKRQKDMKTMKPDPSKVEDAIRYMKARGMMDVHGRQFSAEVPAQVYTVDGREVANVAAGQSTTLVPGTYVANINGSSVKFVVK